jgi:hypothetical protein
LLECGSLLLPHHPATLSQEALVKTLLLGVCHTKLTCLAKLLKLLKLLLLLWRQTRSLGSGSTASCLASCCCCGRDGPADE